MEAAVPGVPGHPLLEMRDVSRAFAVRGGLFAPARELLAVCGVSLAIRRGESVGLVGESGCGKSTLGRLACGLLLPTAGEVLFDGAPLPAAGPASPVGGRIQMVFQDPFSSLDPRMRVGESVAEGLKAARTAQRLGLGGPKAAVRERVAEIFAAVGLAGMERRYPHEFSGGQRQRIALARALVTRPDLVVCDEPVSALDASVQAQVLNVMAELRERLGQSLLFISHDLSVVGFMCSRVLVMYLGELVEELSRERLLAGGAHPYTAALHAAMPDRRRIGMPPEPLVGEIPSPLDPPPGCRFHPRCPVAGQECARVAPPWRELAPGWRVRCHRPLAGRDGT